MKTQEAYDLMFRDYPDVVDATQLSSMLGGIGIRTVYKLLRTGQIKCFFIGNRYLIPKINVFEYLELIEKAVPEYS
jgi:excisionase family DNA binding protein